MVRRLLPVLAVRRAIDLRATCRARAAWSWGRALRGAAALVCPGQLPISRPFADATDLGRPGALRGGVRHAVTPVVGGWGARGHPPPSHAAAHVARGPGVSRVLAHLHLGGPADQVACLAACVPPGRLQMRSQKAQAAVIGGAGGRGAVAAGARRCKMAQLLALRHAAASRQPAPARRQTQPPPPSSDSSIGWCHGTAACTAWPLATGVRCMAPCCWRRCRHSKATATRPPCTRCLQHSCSMARLWLASCCCSCLPCWRRRRLLLTTQPEYKHEFTAARLHATTRTDHQCYLGAACCCCRCCCGC